MTQDSNMASRKTNLQFKHSPPPPCKTTLTQKKDIEGDGQATVVLGSSQNMITLVILVLLAFALISYPML